MSNFDEMKKRRERFDEEFERREKQVNVMVRIGTWITLLSLLVLGSLVVWAFVSVINWVTSK